MSAPVHRRPNLPLREEVSAARIVQGKTHHDVAHLVNHILGRGAQLIPFFYAPIQTITTDTHEWSIYTKPRFQAVERLWSVALGETAETTEFNFHSPVGTVLGTAIRARAGTFDQCLDTDNVKVRQQTLSSQSSASAKISFALDGIDNCEVLGFECLEMPRADLVTTGNANPALNDGGVDVTEVARLEPIYGDATPSNREGSWRAARNLYDPINIDIGRRVGHFCWAVPFKVGGAESTAFSTQVTVTTFTDIVGLDIPLLGRPLVWNNGTAAENTTSHLAWSILYKVGTGDTAEFRLSTTSGNTSTRSGNTSTTYTWSTLSTITCDSELHTASDGRRSSRWDDTTIEARVSGGAPGQIDICGISIFEQ